MVRYNRGKGFAKRGQVLCRECKVCKVWGKEGGWSEELREKREERREEWIGRQRGDGAAAESPAKPLRPAGAASSPLRGAPFCAGKAREESLPSQGRWPSGSDGRRGFAVRGGGRLRRGQDPSLRCKRQKGGIAKLRAGHARPLRTATNGLRTRGAREGGSPPPFPLTGCHGRLRAAYMPPLQSSRSPLRGFGGAWRRTTSAASLLRKPARAVVCPAGANIARSPVSLRSTVAPRSQPRNTRLKGGGRGGGVKNEK